MRRPDERTYSPSEVYRYWHDMRHSSPKLSAAAIDHWLRPAGNAAVERVFSTLTHMDTRTRQSTSSTTLASTLHLRSNQRIMRSLLASTAEELRHSSTIAAHPRTAAAAGQKRTREIAQEAAAVVAARLRAKVADPAVGSDSGSEEDDDVVVAPGTYFDVELDSD